MLRVRFKVFHEDPRPVVWPIPHPYWITGYDSNDAAYLVAYADSEEQIHDLWPDAIDLDSTEVECYEFSDRFPTPEWIVDQIHQGNKKEVR